MDLSGGPEEQQRCLNPFQLDSPAPSDIRHPISATEAATRCKLQVGEIEHTIEAYPKSWLLCQMNDRPVLCLGTVYSSLLLALS
mmetsp:Transcript_25699/g.52704  ORF Transcript_25699/g.52704 Transcript_25699/m.52704 type:complete len:84 (-) Transcript_25699:635-886(-)